MIGRRVRTLFRMAAMVAVGLFDAAGDRSPPPPPMPVAAGPGGARHCPTCRWRRPGPGFRCHILHVNEDHDEQIATYLAHHTDNGRPTDLEPCPGWTGGWPVADVIRSDA